MATRAEVRSIRGLEDKRERDRTGLYVVEGDKLVREALGLHLAVERVYAEPEWARALPSDLAKAAARIAEVSRDDLRRMSSQAAPHAALAVLRKPSRPWSVALAEQDLVLALEDVQDPGNVGSLLRVAAWFGLTDVISTPASADAFGPKAVQASMGAVFHVRVHSLDLVPLLSEVRARGLPVYAAALAGESVYEAELDPRGLLLLGNESSGLSQQSLTLATKRLSIPPGREAGPGRDSLNVGAAAAVVCSEFRRPRRESTGQARSRR